MDALQAITTRRTTRKYEARPVKDADVSDLLAAAMCAPTMGDQRPWQFIVVNDPEVIAALKDAHGHAPFLKQAPVVIAVLADESRVRHKDEWTPDCAAAVENILIAANAKKLGTAWLSVSPDKAKISAVGKIFGLPKGIIPFALVAVGFPAEEKLPKVRFEASRVKYNKW
jgi:nitroreductase